MSANDKQVGGNHYDKEGEQHWDRIYRLHGRGYFVGCATKYIERYHLKNGKQDLEKAIHFIEKLIELEYPKEISSAKFQDIEESLHQIGRSVGIKYPDDYQEQLSLKMDKMREDAMTGIPEHLREEMLRQQHERQVRYERTKVQMSTMPEPLQGAISPMLQKYWGSTEEPMPQGYVNQDGHDVR